MNNLANSIINNWPLDDWSINVEVFSKIVEILPFGSTILEFGSGASSNILKNFYKVISVEDNKEFLNKYTGFEYIYIESDKQGYDYIKLNEKLKNINYQLLIVDGPNNGRENIINHLEFIDPNSLIIWDDTQVYEKYAIEMAKKLNKKYTTFNCKPNGDFWGPRGGKKFTLLE
jgi:hypothetical protein